MKKQIFKIAIAFVLFAISAGTAVAQKGRPTSVEVFNFDDPQEITRVVEASAKAKGNQIVERPQDATFDIQVQLTSIEQRSSWTEFEQPKPPSKGERTKLTIAQVLYNASYEVYRIRRGGYILGQIAYGQASRMEQEVYAQEYRRQNPPRFQVQQCAVKVNIITYDRSEAKSSVAWSIPKVVPVTLYYNIVTPQFDSGDGQVIVRRVVNHQETDQFAVKGDWRQFVAADAVAQALGGQ